MIIEQKVIREVDVSTVQLEVKVSDTGNYRFTSSDDVTIADFVEGRVPDFFPGNHHGDYLYLDIDLETGRITNWRTPSHDDIANAIQED